MFYSNVVNTYIFAAGLYMCTNHHQLNHCNLTFQGALENGLPVSIINISRPNNDCPFSLRNCTAVFQEVKISHNRDAIVTRVYNNATIVHFLNCIITRYGSGCIVALANGGTVYFNSFVK
jgi:hypothetical protein